MKKTTLKDVAREAGVCASTVSRVLSGMTSISEETCVRVRLAAEKLNYTPNSAARSLRCDKTRSIGVVFPDISAEFYAGCASALLKYARQSDYAVLFTQSSSDLNSEKQAVRALMERGVDGILFIGDNDDDAVIYAVAREDIPVAAGDRHPEGIVSVNFNNRETVKKLTDALYDSGRRRFIYIGETAGARHNLKERYAGFEESMAAHPDAKYETIFDERLHGDKLKAGFTIFSERIEKSGADAIVTSNDLIAQGIISAAYRSGIKVPENIAVTGFDDMLSSEYFIPSVTTVRQDTDRLAKECAKRLFALINGETPDDAVIKQSIISRASADI